MEDPGCESWLWEALGGRQGHFNCITSIELDLRRSGCGVCKLHQNRIPPSRGRHANDIEEVEISTELRRLSFRLRNQPTAILERER